MNMRSISKRALFLILLDMVAVFGSYFLAIGIRLKEPNCDFLAFPVFYISIVAHIIFFYIFDLYYPYKKFSFKKETVVEGLFGTIVSTMVLASISYFDRTFTMSRITFVIIPFFLLPGILFNRLVYNSLFSSRFLNKKAIVVGSGALMFEIEHIIKNVPHTGLELVGYIASNDLGEKGPSGLRYLGDGSRLASVLGWYKVDVVVLALDKADDMSESDIVPLLYQSKKTFVTASHLIETLTGLIPYELFGNDFLLGLAYQLQQKPYLRLKRLLDIIFATTLLILSLPIVVSTALALAIYGGPSHIFFFQTRVGRHRRPFLMYKFRSMRTKKDGDMVITRIGHWIRKFRIDEIPQLINIIKGDMSLIGPRPETDFFSDLCQKHIPLYRVIGELKPGLTGWAQIKLSHVTSLKDYKAKFSYNLYYLKNLSLALDLEIVMSTIRIVLLGKGK